MTLSIEHPWSLLLGLLAVPIVWMAWQSLPVLGGTRAWIGLSIRLLVLGLLALAIARPNLVRDATALSLVVVVDESSSVPRNLLQTAESAIRNGVTRDARPDDRVATVVTASRAEITSLATPGEWQGVASPAVSRQATNLAAGIQAALAIKPPDTTGRILLVSDGNQTAGSLLEAADLARASGVPIDVMPIEYEHTREVLVESVQAPTRARIGQSIDLRVSIRSQAAATGRLRLWQDDEPVPLGDDDDLGFPVTLQPGPNLAVLPAVPTGNGAHRFRVSFEADDPSSDSIAENNLGATVVFVGDHGRVLIVEPEGGVEGEQLARALKQGGMDIESISPEEATTRGLPALAGFDAVVLANIPRWTVTNELDRALHTYVHDLGGGLLMLGGPESFGAGGWLGSEVAKALPVRMDPPQTRQLLRSALAIVIDNSGSMCGPVGGSGVTKQDVADEGAVAALKVLSRLDDVAVIAFNGATEIVAPLARKGDGAYVEERLKHMGSGGGTVMLPALEAGGNELRKSRAGLKHMIVLTDGMSSDDQSALVDKAAQLRAEGVTVSTIMIGDDASRGILNKIASAGGGRAHDVRAQRAAVELPQIFIREATMIARSLTVEGDFATAMLPTAGGPLGGVQEPPGVRGYVLCVPREGLATISTVVRNSEGNDPLFAYWNYGTGRSVAFTSDATARWAASWVGWSDFQRFWEQSVRWVMRPAMPQAVAVTTRVDGDRAFVEVASQEQNRGFAAAAQATGRVVRPDGTVGELPLRQLSSGRFVGEFVLEQPGAYLTDVTFATAGDSGDIRAGSVQAAVSVAYPAEFRATHDDRALLRAVAERTGGRVLQPATLSGVDLFERQGLGTARTTQAMWDLAAIVAAILLLGDIAWRRLYIGRRDAMEWAQLIGIAAVPTQPHAAPPDAKEAGASPVQLDAWSSLKSARDRAGHRAGDSQSLVDSEDSQSGNRNS